VSGRELSPDEMMVLVQLERQRGRGGRVALWLDADGGDLPHGWKAPARFWALASEAALAGGDANVALQAIDRAVERASTVAVYHHNRAAILVQLGRQDEARRALDEARRLDPNIGESP